MTYLFPVSENALCSTNLWFPGWSFIMSKYCYIHVLLDYRMCALFKVCVSRRSELFQMFVLCCIPLSALSFDDVPQDLWWVSCCFTETDVGSEVKLGIMNSRNARYNTLNRSNYYYCCSVRLLSISVNLVAHSFLFLGFYLANHKLQSRFCTHGLQNAVIFFSCDILCRHEAVICDVLCSWPFRHQSDRSPSTILTCWNILIISCYFLFISSMWDLGAMDWHREQYLGKLKFSYVSGMYSKTDNVCMIFND